MSHTVYQDACASPMARNSYLFCLSNQAVRTVAYCFVSICRPPYVWIRMCGCRLRRSCTLVPMTTSSSTPYQASRGTSIALMSSSIVCCSMQCSRVLRAGTQPSESSFILFAGGKMKANRLMSSGVIKLRLVERYRASRTLVRRLAIWLRI